EQDARDRPEPLVLLKAFEGLGAEADNGNWRHPVGTVARDRPIATTKRLRQQRQEGLAFGGSLIREQLFTLIDWNDNRGSGRITTEPSLRHFLKFDELAGKTIRVTQDLQDIRSVFRSCSMAKCLAQTHNKSAWTG